MKFNYRIQLKTVCQKGQLFIMSQFIHFPQYLQKLSAAEVSESVCLCERVQNLQVVWDLSKQRHTGSFRVFHKIQYCLTVSSNVSLHQQIFSKCKKIWIKLKELKIQMQILNYVVSITKPYHLKTRPLTFYNL